MPMKTTLIALAAATLGLAVASPSLALGKFAGCYVEKNGRIITRGECKFHPNGPRGSFQVSGEYKADLGRGVAHLDVKVGRAGTGVAYARLTNGAYVRWGAVSRSTADRACWIGSGLKICAR